MFFIDKKLTFEKFSKTKSLQKLGLGVFFDLFTIYDKNEKQLLKRLMFYLSCIKVAKIKHNEKNGFVLQSPMMMDAFKFFSHSLLA